MVTHVGFTMVVLFGVFTAVTSLRVDNRRGFRYCNNKKWPNRKDIIVDRVDVLGRACSQWPCIMTPGRIGTFEVTLSQNRGMRGRYYHDLKTNILANARFKFGGSKRVWLDGEVRKPACPFTRPGCPFTPEYPIVISKTVEVPREVRMVKSPLIVEFQITNGDKEMLVCFKAPVIVG